MSINPDTQTENSNEFEIFARVFLESQIKKPSLYKRNSDNNDIFA